ncbi:hypothetical protein PybrP1_001700 [[Pythium] brassicae (nom. inval.)]|nr:hypothetical protein PybrP1_001700 [[Pythium] brassicae (nom. inval.)]
MVSVKSSRWHSMDRMNGTADLRAILTDNGEEQLFKFVMERGSRADQEPPLVLHWQHAGKFVDAARTLQLESFRLAAAAPIGVASSAAVPAATEPPFALPAPLTVHGFKVALFDYLRCESDEIPGDPVERASCRTAWTISASAPRRWWSYAITPGSSA